MLYPRLIRLGVAGSLVLSGLVFLPASVSASSSTDYVVVRNDGSVEVQNLSTSQAESLAGQSDVRIVEPDKNITVPEKGTDVVQGLSVPQGAQSGDVIPGRYIVSFSGSVASNVAVASMQDNVVTTFSNAMNGFVADLTQAQVASLRENPNVLSIEQDSVVTVAIDQVPPSWGLDRIDQRALPVNSKYSYTQTGSGVTAYVIDTGINPVHTDFSGRIRSGFSAVADANGSNDCHGHGTHVAGTIGGTKYGVAKSVSLVPIRVLGCDGSGSVSGVISGIDWAVANHLAGVPAVANLSIGGGLSSTLNSAIARGTADGITMVVAAGNDGLDACSYSPSSEPSAITVGATTSVDARATYSNTGTCVDIFAPGSSIVSDYIGSTTATATMSGTSMASPHVAGVAALYLQTNPTATPATVASTLLTAATNGLPTNAGIGSPSKLLYSASFAAAPTTVPTAPPTLTATAADRSVSLAWTTPSSNGGSAITDYIIQFTSGSNTTWTTFVDGVSIALATTVTGLTSGVVYTFRVAAVNTVGTSPTSVTAAAMPTLAGAPSQPVGLIGTSGRLTAALSWTAPLSTNGAAISDYIVQYSADNGATWLTFTDGVSTSLVASVTGLLAGTTYLFRVAAQNSFGVGAQSATTSVTPTAFSQPSIVRSIRATATLLGATITWTAPSDNGGVAITMYVLDYSTDNGVSYSGRITTSATASSASIAGLTGGVPHLVRVRAANAYGSSPDATATTTPIAVLVPSAPRSVSTSVSYNSATVYWATPLSNGGAVIANYVVEFSSNAATSWTRSSLLSSFSRAFTLRNLAGGTSYQVRVVAINAAGESAPSVAATAVPLANTVPTAPRYFNGFLSSAGTTAYLSWSNPSSNGGAELLTSYVEVSTDNAVTWSAAASIAAPARTVTISGLTTGINYSYRVSVKNSVGRSTYSNIVQLFRKVVGAPNPPAALKATVENTTVKLVWTAATATTAAPITDYVMEYNIGNSVEWFVFNDGISTNLSATVVGFAADIPVVFRVRAVNKFGTSPASATVSVTPRNAPAIPSEPLAVDAVAGDTRVAMRWNAPSSNGGSAITGFTVTSNPSGLTCTTVNFACVVSNLVNGVAYTFTVTATNAIGIGPSSLMSNSVIPVSGGIPAVSAASWGLDRVDQRGLPLDGLVARSGTGTGVTAYVIDTGVLATQTEFTGRIASGFTSISDGRGTSDCHGHGTHVAGTIGGSTYGFATSATIVPVRVLDCSGSGTTSGVIAGINWVISHHVAGTAAVANLSLGGGYDLATNDAIDRGVADGITFVVAAGNSAADACTSSPASTPSAITVAASTSSDARASYSNFGACVDTYAPGSSIVSAGISSASASTVMSGTSMAAPHVAGVAAIILGNSQKLTPSQVAAQLASDASIGIISGNTGGTVNSLLYMKPTAASSLVAFDEDNIDGQIDAVPMSDESASLMSYEEDVAPSAPQSPIVENKPEVIAPSRETSITVPAPTVMTISEDVAVVAPVFAPVSTVSQPVRNTTSVVITSVKKTGKKVKITVSSPAGFVVKLYRNGKFVAKGARNIFIIPRTTGSKYRFNAVASLNGAFVSSRVVTYSLRTGILS